MAANVGRATQPGRVEVPAARAVARREPSGRGAALLAVQRTAGNRAATAVVQRVIDPNEWITTIVPKLTANVFAVVRDGQNTMKMVRQRTGGGFEEIVANGQWTPIANVATFCQQHTWSGKMRRTKDGKVDVIDFSTPNSLHSNIDPGVNEMDVQDVPGDRHHLVHHSYSTYQVPGSGKGARPQRREAGHHLTVENAHLLYLVSLENEKTGAYLDKTQLKKPDVNKQLIGLGMNEIDNLNFFPRKQAQQSAPLRLSEQDLPTDRLPQEDENLASEAVDESLSLQQYLAFIQRVIERLPNVPPVYAAKILHAAQVMHQLTGLDPAQLFLKVGKGDQRQLIRAVMTIKQKGFAPELVIPAPTLQVFERYWTSKPDLPYEEPVQQNTEWVAKAAQSNTKPMKHWNDLETQYVSAHYQHFVTALTNYIA